MSVGVRLKEYKIAEDGYGKEHCCTLPNGGTRERAAHHSGEKDSAHEIGEDAFVAACWRREVARRR